MEARKSDDDDNRGQSRRFPVEAMRRGEEKEETTNVRSGSKSSKLSTN